MTETIKFCKDCKYFSSSGAECKKEVYEQCLVYGTCYYRKCAVTRDLPHLCGKDAKWYEAK